MRYCCDLLKKIYKSHGHLVYVLIFFEDISFMLSFLNGIYGVIFFWIESIIFFRNKENLNSIKSECGS